MALKIQFTNDKGETIQTYKVNGMKTGIVDKCFEVAEKTSKLDMEHMSLKEMREFYEDIRLLLVDVFRGQFTLDELKEHVEQKELWVCFNNVLKFIGLKIIGKN